MTDFLDVVKRRGLVVIPSSGGHLLVEGDVDLSGSDIANRLKNDYSRSPDMWQRSIAGCYQNNVAWLYCDIAG